MRSASRGDYGNKSAHPRPVVGCERTLFGQQERKYSRGTQGVAQEFAKHRGGPVKLDAALVSDV